MNRTARLLVAVTAAGLALTGCATGLTAGDRAASPASVQAADDGGSAVQIPPSPSEAPGTVGAAPGTVTGDGFSVSEDGVTGPGFSVSEDGVTGPGFSVGPDGVVVDPSLMEGSPGSGAGTEAEEQVEAAYVDRACGEGENVTVSIPGSTFNLYGSCGSITVTADDAYVNAEGAGAVSVSGDDNTVNVGSHTSLEISGSSNYVNFGDGPAPVDTGTGNTVTG